MIDDAIRSIAGALSPEPQASNARWRWGTVVTVNADGTMNVNVGGSTIPGIRAAQHCMGAQVGDRVRVAYYGTDAVVDAVRASAKLMSLPTISSAILLKDERLDRDGTAPSSNTYSRIVGIQDKDGENVAYIQAAQYSDGRTGCIISAYNEKSDGTAVGNTINVMVAKDGTRSYSVTDAAAFRNAINAAGVSNQSAQNVVFTSGSGTEQVQIIGFNVTNESHALSGKRLTLLLRSNGIDLYNSTDSSYIWQYRTTVSTPTFTATTANWTVSETYIQQSGKVVSVSLAGQAKAGVGTWVNNTYQIGTISAHPSATKLFMAVAQISSDFVSFLGKIDTSGKVYLRTAGTAIPANTYVWLDTTFIIG